MIKTHAVYIALIAGLLFFARVWLSEHDARVAAENTIKQSQGLVKSLQDQIAATNAQAATKVQTVVKIVHDAATPAQIVSAVPRLTDAPFNTRVATDNPLQVSVDALPFVALLGQAKEDAINLAACKADLSSETAIASQKDTQIAALKKKPKFLIRVKHVAEAVGVGIAIGLFLGQKMP